MPEQRRRVLFISHATPEDNPFALWLGAKLSACGYSVFADVLSLRGGDDWERILEDAIRQKAAKVLLVGTPLGVQKQGVRNEITIATQTGKKIGDTNFIIPLRLETFESQMQIAHAHYIEFSKSWAAGLADLLSLIDELKIPKSSDHDEVALWQGVQLQDARVLGPGPERLTSNWLEIERIPNRLHFYDFKGGISLGAAQKAIQNARIPMVPFNRGFLSFAPMHQLQDYFGENLPLELIAAHVTDDFLKSGWPSQHITSRDARAKFTDISRRAMDSFFMERGLQSFEFASGRLAWWATSGQAGLKRLSFKWDGATSGSRQIVGHSRKRGFYWHYGVTCWARTGPMPHMCIGGRVIFTSDGHQAIGDAGRLHRMRRSFCKSWRNAKWRDLLLAFWFWLAKGATFLDVPMGENESMRLRLPPMVFDAPFGISIQDDFSEGDEDEDDSELVANEDLDELDDEPWPD